jgi:hypothetical protein
MRLERQRDEAMRVRDRSRRAISASETGDLDELKRLRVEGLEWSPDICRAAASHGHLKLLQWARNNGCPWNRQECMRMSSCYDDVNHWIVHGTAMKGGRKRRPRKH